MLEVIAVRADDALHARDYGAQRIELVAAIEVGGLTPDAALIEHTVRHSGLPVMVMARPHARAFVYDHADMGEVRLAIETSRKLGAHGIVFGSLDASGNIHTAQLEQVIAWADGLSITFHRAFDEARDIVHAWRTLGRYKGEVSRVLSSGGASDALTGSAILAQLQRTRCGIDLLVGAGVNADTLPAIASVTQARQFHSGAGAREQGRFDQPLSRPAIQAMRAYLDRLATANSE
jgi:copper homeostasis protein